MDGWTVVNPPMFYDMGKDTADSIATVQFPQSIVHIDMLGGVHASNEARTIGGIMPAAYFNPRSAEKFYGCLRQRFLLRRPASHGATDLSTHASGKRRHAGFISIRLAARRDTPLPGNYDQGCPKSEHDSAGMAGGLHHESVYHPASQRSLPRYPPALPTGPPGSVMRQGSRSSARRFSGSTFCSCATVRTVLPDL